MMQMRSLILAKVLLFSWYTAEAFVALSYSCGLGRQETYSHETGLHGWFDNFWQTEDSASASRQVEYPEQYPATYESNAITLEADKVDERKLLIRQLLKNTQLESRPLTLAYQASRD
jgi:hypothetical protein